MMTTRTKETTAAVAAMTAIAAIAVSLMMATDASAAGTDTKTKKAKSTVTVRRAVRRKPVYVKMVGDRRAAETAARQAYSNQLAAEQAQAQQAQVEAYGSAYTVYGDNDTTTVAANTLPPTGQDYYPSVSVGYPGSISPPINYFVPSYGYFNQTITIPGNGYGGAPSVNSFGTNPFFGGMGYGSGFNSGYSSYGSPGVFQGVGF